MYGTKGVLPKPRLLAHGFVTVYSIRKYGTEQSYTDTERTSLAVMNGLASKQIRCGMTVSSGCVKVSLGSSMLAAGRAAAWALQ
jgi:hypothetical protein